MNTLHVDTLDGFQLVTLASPEAEVTVVPGLGAKIISLRSPVGGRDWMWRPDGPLRLFHAPDGNFGKGPMTGLDECLPTINRCHHAGRDLPDHGEAWNVAWTLEESSPDGVRTSLRLPLSPLHMLRTVTVKGPCVRLHYTLTNHGPQPESWLWALHPLLTFDPDDRLELPAAVSEFRVAAARQPDARPGDVWAWPEPFPGLRLDALTLGGNDSFLKAFAGPMREGWARLSNARLGDSLTLRWDTTTNPYLALWLTRGGCLGMHHAALEPTNVPFDSLTEAVEAKLARPLAPGTSVSWWCEFEVQALPQKAFRAVPVNVV